MLIFNSFFVVVKMTERRKKTKQIMDFNLLFIYFITVNKYRFCISVIGYINMQIIGIGIGYKKINIGQSLFSIPKSKSPSKLPSIGTAAKPNLHKTGQAHWPTDGLVGGTTLCQHILSC